MNSDQEKKLNEVHTAIVGNDLGQKGIVKRLEDLEKYEQRDKIYKAKVAGGLAIGTPIFVAFWHWLIK